MDLNLPLVDEDGDDTFIFSAGGCTQFCTQSAAEQGGLPNDIGASANDELHEVSELRLSLEDTHLDAVNEGNEIPVLEQIVLEGTTAAAGDSSSAGEMGFEVFSTPQEPYIGMTFDSIDEARNLYNAYAGKKGFSIRKSTSCRTGFAGEINKMQFVCNKEGKGKKPKTTIDIIDAEQIAYNSGGSNSESGDSKKMHIGKKRKREKMVHTNCKAKMLIKFNGTNWEVMQFVAEHNHDLVNKPYLTKFLKSHASIPEEEVNFLRLLHSCNVETSRMMQLVSELYGSTHNVPYTAKHVSNLRSSIRSETAGYDIAETVAYFNEQQREDPNFFFKVKLDQSGKLENMFWVDGPAREAYKTYNDCISFDSTYLTNKYKMPFAPFIAINRHGQSIQVGCGLLRNESAGSYEWLFEMFLEAMGGKEPANIITDQDLSMAAAVRNVFKTCRHRCCRWHILSKIKARLNHYFSKKAGMQKKFYDIINHSFSPSKFESRWAAMVAKYSAGDNELLRHLYGIRQLWVPAYFMDCFFPFFQSTQRSEGFNTVLKRYINPKNSILEFTYQYKKIQEKTDVAESGEDYRTGQKVPDLWSKYPIKKNALEIYTRKIYWVFRAELEKTTEYVAKQVGPSLFRLTPITEDVCDYGTRIYEVTFVEDASYFACECCKFQRDGLLCCHILKVATKHGVTEIPGQYILKRWTPLENAVTITAFPGMQQPPMPERSKKQLRFAGLASSLAKIAVSACGSDETRDIVKGYIKIMESELAAQKKSKRKKADAQKPTARMTQAVPQNTTSTAPNTMGEHRAWQHPIGTMPPGYSVEQQGNIGVENVASLGNVICGSGKSMHHANTQVLQQASNACDNPNNLIEEGISRTSHIFIDLDTSKTKGRTRTRRFKSPAEKQSTKAASKHTHN